MNIVALIGNVASEPELRHTTQGRPVTSFRLALSRPGGELADFVTIVTWERQAEIAHEYLVRGRRVGVDGRIHHSTWETEEGKRSKIEIVAHRIILLDRPKARPENAEKPSEGGEETPPQELIADTESLALA
jgi:single-strand DNA-binding protein